MIVEVALHEDFKSQKKGKDMLRIEQGELLELLIESVNLKLIEPQIYTVLPDTKVENAYDQKFGSFYDRVACSPIYNRLMWGYCTAGFASLVHDALRSSEKGNVLDVGCGALAFTAKNYAAYSERPVILLDQSLKLLKIAKDRMIRTAGSVPDNMVFLHGDALQLTFKPQCFETVISLNLLHFIRDLQKAMMNIKRLLAKNGKLFLTTLIMNHRMSDRYLKMWENRGGGGDLPEHGTIDGPLKPPENDR